MTRVFCAALLFAITFVPQDVDRARALIEQALAALQPAPPRAALTSIATAAALDAALATAAPGAVLMLSANLVYAVPLTLKQSVTLKSDVPAGRMTRDQPLPTFSAGLTITGDDVTLIGIDVRHTNPLTDIVVIKGARVTLDRVRVLGDPAKGAKRGIAANGNGDVKISRSYVDDCFATYPGSDSQAITAWDMAPGLLVEDNFLSGASETIMIGGSDPSSEDRSPKDITIRHNTITKNLAWQALPIGVKNILELKNARNVLIDDNDLSNVWGGKGQTGYAWMITVRNQDGRAPYSTVQDVTIQNNRTAHASAAISILGRDDIKETAAGRPVPIGTIRQSVPMARVTFRRNTFTDLDPVRFTGSKQMVQIGGGPIDLTIGGLDPADGNTFAGTGLASALYFASGPPSERLTFANNTVPITTYRVFGSNVSAPNTAARFDPVLNAAWKQYVASGVLSGNTETP